MTGRTRRRLGRVGAAALLALAAGPARAERDGEDEGEACNAAVPLEVLAEAGRLEPVEPAASAAAAPGAPAPPPPSTSAGPGPAVAAADALTWAPDRGPECHRYRRRRVCEGPRRVPVPDAAAAARAAALGLGGRDAASRLLTGAPDAAWPAAAGDDRAAALTWMVPEGRLWRGFQPRRRRRPAHPGLDLGAAEGAPIHAARGGLVAYADNGVRGFGNLLVVVHPDGSTAWYAHARALYVAAGALVRRGQAVGAVGQTGLAHGPHLHFELRLDGEPVDPLPLLIDVPEGALPPGLAAQTPAAQTPAASVDPAP